MNFDSPPDSPSFNSYSSVNKGHHSSHLSGKFQNHTRHISSFTTRIDDMITAATSKVARGNPFTNNGNSGSGNHHRLVNENDSLHHENDDIEENNSVVKLKSSNSWNVGKSVNNSSYSYSQKLQTNDIDEEDDDEINHGERNNNNDNDGDNDDEVTVELTTFHNIRQ